VQRSDPVAYIGRFAPSPTGPLHAGSMVAALASWLDARTHDGQWLLRIEDLDQPRCSRAAEDAIQRQLHACGLIADGPVRRQSDDTSRYAGALAALQARGQAYRCHCSRRAVAQALAAVGRGVQRHQGLAYPGTCRHAGHLEGGAVRLLTVAADGQDRCIEWIDRRLGAQQQNVTQAVGDFVLLRADGLWSYQLAVVIDDADQGVTDIVRGEDLADNTARQILLQRALGLPTPRYLHTPLVRAADGQKLSKQNGACAVDVRDPVAVLAAAARVLGLPAALCEAGDAPLGDWLARAVPAWRSHWAKLA
jgi:glutamyl-Q tRNA(Asp) synthetase